MSSIARKPVFGVFPNSSDTNRAVQAGNFGYRKKRDCTICVAKIKVLISSAVTAQLICIFVFAYAKKRFSHDVAHFMYKSYKYATSKYVSLVVRKPVFWFPTWSDTNQAVQLQRMARGFKFWI